MPEGNYKANGIMCVVQANWYSMDDNLGNYPQLNIVYDPSIANNSTEVASISLYKGNDMVQM